MLIYENNTLSLIYLHSRANSKWKQARHWTKQAGDHNSQTARVCRYETLAVHICSTLSVIIMINLVSSDKPSVPKGKNRDCWSEAVYFTI